MIWYKVCLEKEREGFRYRRYLFNYPLCLLHFVLPNMKHEQHIPDPQQRKEGREGMDLMYENKHSTHRPPPTARPRPPNPHID